MKKPHGYQAMSPKAKAAIDAALAKPKPTGYVATGPLTFVMPMPPNLANGRMHWRVKHNAKVAYWEALDFCLVQSHFPDIATIQRATITAHLVLGRTMDADNALARCKWAVDWLVARKYLVGDSPKHLTWGGIPTQTVRRKEPATLTLTVTPDA